MLNKVVFAALVPAIVAKPIVQPTATNAPQVDRRQFEVNSTMVSSLSEQVASSIWNGASSAVAVAFASSLADAIAEDLANLPPQKRQAEATPTASSDPVSSASSASSVARPEATPQSCDCIGECDYIDGKAEQMQCIKKCASSCDGDDDKNDLNTSLQQLLNGTLLGLRDVPHPNTHFHHPKPVHEAAGSDEQTYESCMNSCKTHNCQHSEVGIDISQCGDTSCEDSCAQFKKADADKIIFKKDVRPVPHRHAKTHPPPKAVVPVEAGAKGEEEFEACMRNCSTHNCQKSEVGINISQCGDTSCEDSCAKYKKAESVETKTGHIIHKKQLRPVGNHAKQANPGPPEVDVAASSHEEDFEACVKKCQTHNCQNSEVGIGLSNCGDTSCEDSCASRSKAGSSASARVHQHARPKPKRPAVHARGRVADDVKNEAKGVAPVASKAHKETFETCMQKCSTHNCQSADIGLEISQCGDTSCEEDCTKYKDEASAEVDVKKTHPPPEPHLNIPVNAPVPKPPVSRSGTGEVPAVAAVPPVSDVPAVPVAEAHSSTEYENCMQKCKTHNCQKADIGLDVSQCGDTSCESACVQYKGEAAAHAGPV